MSAATKSNASELIRISDLPEVVPVSTFCRVVGIADSTGYAMIAKGEVPTVRIGSRLRVRRDVVEAIAAGVDPWEVQQDAVDALGGHR